MLKLANHITDGQRTCRYIELGTVCREHRGDMEKPCLGVHFLWCITMNICYRSGRFGKEYPCPRSVRLETDVAKETPLDT